MITCTQCKINKKENEFPVHSKTPNIVYRHICKPCYSNKRKSKVKSLNYPAQWNKIKKCSVCKQDKNGMEFYPNKRKSDGLNYHCIDCNRIKSLNDYRKNPEKIKICSFQRYLTIKDTEEYKNQKRDYQRKKLKEEPLYKISRNLRCRMWHAIKNKGWDKKNKLNEYIGCSPKELFNYIEEKFNENMTWENYGSYWHLDHIVPLDSAKTIEELEKLSHYKNLQPLESTENLKKGAHVAWQKEQRDFYLEDDFLEVGDLSYLKASDFILQKEEFSEEHREFIEKYEWLGTIGFYPKYIFTARHNDILGGVVVLSEPTYPQFSSTKEALIQRGACASWTPKNLGSRLITFSCRWMVKNTEKKVFVAYGDPEAGEVGTIYQACNFKYLGQKFGSKYLYKLPNGKETTGRRFTATGQFKKIAKDLGIIWQKEWDKLNGFVDRKKIPIEIKELLLKTAREFKQSLPKREIPLKHKYAISYDKEIIIEGLPYPKRNTN